MESKNERHSPAVEDYAKAIYTLQRRADSPVTTTALAERLDVSAASASGMVRRLSEIGLVKHEPYKGVELTERGNAVASAAMRGGGARGGGGDASTSSMRRSDSFSAILDELPRSASLLQLQQAASAASASAGNSATRIRT